MICGCGSKNIKNNIKNYKDFYDDVSNIYDTVLNYDNFGYNLMVAEKNVGSNNSIFTKYYNSFPLDMDFSEVTEIDETIDGLSGIVVNYGGDYYLSFEKDDKCAVKPFDSETIKIYDKGDDKCHIPYSYEEESEVLLLATTQNFGVIYQSGLVVHEPVKIQLFTNIIDPKSYTYELYRNDEKIDFDTILTIDHNESATYYFKAKDTEGVEYTSNKVHVIVDIPTEN